MTVDAYIHGATRAEPFDVGPEDAEWLVLVFVPRASAADLHALALLERDVAESGARLAVVSRSTHAQIRDALAGAVPAVRLPVLADPVGGLAAAYGVDGRATVVLDAAGAVRARGGAVADEALRVLRAVRRGGTAAGVPRRHLVAVA